MAKARKGGGRSLSASSPSGTDTRRWESLLSAGRSKPPPAHLTLGHAISIKASPAAAASGPTAALDSRTPSAPRSTAKSGADKLPTKTREQGNFSRGAAAKNSNAVGPSNWEMLLTGGKATAAAAAAAVAAASSTTAPSSNGPSPHSSAHKTGLKKNKKKRGRPDAGHVNGTSTPATPDFFTAQQRTMTHVAASNGAASDHQPSGASTSAVVGNGVGKAGKKRKRSGATDSRASAGAGDRDGIASSYASLGNGELAGSKRTFPAAPDVGSKRPRSNVLNLAFQAQKSAAAAGGEAKQKGGDKGRGRARGGGKAGRGGVEQEPTAAEQAQYVALDCEMVGVGPGGCRSALARCCIVDWGGNIIYDKYVMPNERVTDFRTFVSGVKATHLKGGLRLRQCQEEVAAIVKDKVLVGHALAHDLKALMMGHSARMIRDTATYRPYQKAHGKAGGKLRPKSLKNLAQEILERTIQTGQHHPAEDACAAMDLYKAARSEWEKSLSAAGKMRARRAVVDQQDR